MAIKAQRSDSKRSVEGILAAAERTLAQDPGASLATIAHAAGVDRATIYRRFESREDLLRALLDVANARLLAALEVAEADEISAMTLCQLTTTSLELKTAWHFTMRIGPAGTGANSAPSEDVLNRLSAYFGRARAAGLFSAEFDVAWIRVTYLALLQAVAALRTDSSMSAPEAAQLLVRTLLDGLGRPQTDIGIALPPR